MQHRDIVINGRNIAYYESTGTGQTVLFIHGNSMSGLCFEKQFNSAIGAQFRLIALDLPGHGKSGPAADPQSDYTLPAYATVVVEFARRLEIEDAVLVGWSLGGHVLLEASGRLPKSAGLMIFGAPPVDKPMASDAFMPNPLFPLTFKRDLSEQESVAVTAGFFKPDSRIPAFFIEDMRRTDGRAREALGGSVAEGNYADEVHIVAGLDKPVAVLQGEKESIVNLAYLKNLAIPALWRGEVQIVADAGHALHWEQPESFNFLLREFIKEL